ncbi:hypothetical protein Tco_0059059 [Tanacetum coccineum]
MTKASSIACVLGCNRVTKYVWLLEVMFEVGFRGVVSCGLPLTSLSASLVVTLVDVMSVNDEGVVSISITKPVVCRTDLDTSKRRSRSKISQQRITWVGTERRIEWSIFSSANERVSVKAPRLCAHVVHGAMFDSAEALGSLEARGSILDRLRCVLAIPLRFVVTAFTGSTYEFKLEKSIIRVTLEKVHQFGQNILKDIRAMILLNVGAPKKRVDFMFKVNFLMLFANVMGTADTMKAILLVFSFIKVEQEEVIGKLELHGPWRESELHETEGFYEVGDNVSRTRTSLKPPTDKQCVCSLIEEKLKIISDEKAELENLLRKANTQFPNDEGCAWSLYDEFGGVFKDTVFLEESKFMLYDVHRPPGDGENVVTDVAGVKSRSCILIRLNMETLAPKIVDRFQCIGICWVANLKHEELVKVESRQQKAFFFNLVALWDVGLCTESEKQVSLLRRMRFKIATNILLHELNIHSQKMFDLAYKFETDNDEQTRISIIVNAIKNKAESDPVKNVVQNKEGDEVKNVVKNQEGDAVKSK